MNARPRRAKRKRVAVVTGTRAEYGLLQSTIAAITNRRELELQLVVTGMHLLRAFGHTIDQIVADGWPIAARVPMQRGDDSPTDQAVGLSRGVAGLAKFFEHAHTDVVLVLGDRIEAMAAALAATTTGRVLAHIHGGDVAPGDFDDSLRHAITKLAHIHFPATRNAARRIVRMGQRPETVHVVGAPGLDRLCELVDASPRRKPRGDTALIVQHACGRSAEDEQRAMERILNATAATGLHRVIVYPNTDRGHVGVVRAIQQHKCATSNGDVVTFRSLPRDEYLRQLINARVLIGNSSSGVIEAPIAGTPSVNIGDRQAGREVAGPSVVHAGERPAEIRAALLTALGKRPRAGAATPYGDGHAGKRIAAKLVELHITPELRRKTLAY